MMGLELIGGLIYLLLGGDLLVRGATALAREANVSPVVVGLTVVAFGTSAPELFVSLGAVYNALPAMSVGNVVGSNVANVLLVLGVPALITAMPCNQKGIGIHLAIMLGTTLLFIVLCRDGALGLGDGALLLGVLAVFLVVSLRQGTLDEEAREELERVFGLPSTPLRIGAFLLLGSVFLPLGAELMVGAGGRIASAYGVSEGVVGLTVFALGTSLPELGTTLVAAMLGETEVAIGNVVGSNIFNLAAIMGITSIVSPETLPVPPAFMALDVWVMLASALLLTLFAWRGASIGRVSGGLLLAGYAGYLGLLLSGTTAA